MGPCTAVRAACGQAQLRVCSQLRKDSHQARVCRATDLIQQAQAGSTVALGAEPRQAVVQRTTAQSGQVSVALEHQVERIRQQEANLCETMRRPPLMRLDQHNSLASAVASGGLLWMLLPQEAWADEAAIASTVAASSWSDTLSQAIEASGWAGPALFVALYVLSTVLLFPASVLTLIAGALYGPLQGTVLVSFASTTAAAVAFALSRGLARPWVEQQLAKAGQPRWQALLRGVSSGRSGVWVVFLLRLSPLVPFNLLNYALGLTQVTLLEYTLASWLGMLPGTFAYVYLGGTGRAAVDAAGGGGMDPVKLTLYVVGAAATLGATKLISNAASTALEETERKQQAGGSDGTP